MSVWFTIEQIDPDAFWELKSFFEKPSLLTKSDIFDLVETRNKVDEFREYESTFKNDNIYPLSGELLADLYGLLASEKSLEIHGGYYDLLEILSCDESLRPLSNIFCRHESELILPHAISEIETFHVFSWEILMSHLDKIQRFKLKEDVLKLKTDLSSISFKENIFNKGKAEKKNKIIDSWIGGETWNMWKSFLDMTCEIIQQKKYLGFNFSD